jgi:hypothetical protein
MADLIMFRRGYIYHFVIETICDDFWMMMATHAVRSLVLGGGSGLQPEGLILTVFLYATPLLYAGQRMAVEI